MKTPPEVIRDMNDLNPWLIVSVGEYGSIGHMLEDTGYSDLKKFIIEEYNEEEKLEKYTEVITNWFSIVVPTKIKVVQFGDSYSEQANVEVTGYKYLDIEYIGDRQYYAMLHNLEPDKE